MNQSLRACSCLSLFLAAAFAHASDKAVVTLESDTDPADLEWRAAGERLTVHWLDERLAAWDLRIGRSGSRAGFSLDFGAQELRFTAPAGLFEKASSGRFDLASPLRLDIKGRQVELTDAAIVARSGSPLRLDLVDSDGGIWWQMLNIHHVLEPEKHSLSFRNFDIRVGPRLAQALGEPRLAGEQMGYGRLDARVTERQSAPLRANRCAVPNWPTPGNPGDVALEALNAFQYMRGRNIDGPGGQDGEMVVAPDAYLRNAGTRDIPWYRKFSGNFPPYGNDQHPMLVWSLYRIDQDGELRQIARSGVKHAFLTINDGCDCTNFNILGLNCGDVYAAGNNDTPSFSSCFFVDSCDLGPRNEIDPHSGIWGRCGSIYDPNCDGSANDLQNYGVYDHRMVVRESAIDPTLHPGARYFFDGWYVVRDDGNIFNSMGHASLVPTYLAGAEQWLFNNEVGPFRNGTVLERWQEQLPTPTASALTTIERPEGFVQVGVRVVPGSVRAWRYQYVVLNLDWMQSTITGSAPNQRLTSSIGLTQLRIPVSSASLSGLRFFDGDEISSNDWVSQQNQGFVQWTAPTGTSQAWASAYSFGFETDAPPVPGQVQISGGALGQSTFAADLRIPFADALLRDGFEP